MPSLPCCTLAASFLAPRGIASSVQASGWRNLPRPGAGAQPSSPRALCWCSPYGRCTPSLAQASFPGFRLCAKPCASSPASIFYVEWQGSRLPRSHPAAMAPCFGGGAQQSASQSVRCILLALGRLGPTYLGPRPNSFKPTAETRSSGVMMSPCDKRQVHWRDRGQSCVRS